MLICNLNYQQAHAIMESLQDVPATAWSDYDPATITAAAAITAATSATARAAKANAAGIWGEVYSIATAYAAAPQEGETLKHLLNRAANAAAAAAKRATVRAEQCNERYSTAPDGTEISELDTIPAAESPETDAIRAATLAAIHAAARDDLDRRLIYLLSEGYTLREMAPMLGISHQAISKRIKGIRQRAAAAIG